MHVLDDELYQFVDTVWVHYMVHGLICDRHSSLRARLQLSGLSVNTSAFSSQSVIK